jgi:hypothetical protein
MIFHFENAPFRGIRAVSMIAGRSADPRRRPRLVARWHRAEDGKLECRWQRLPTNDPPD